MFGRGTVLGGVGASLLVVVVAVSVVGVAGGAAPADGAGAETVAGGERVPSVEVVVNETYDASWAGGVGGLVALPDGGYLFGGSVVADGDRDVVVLEVAGDGRVESRRRFGGPERQWLEDLVRTTDGGYAFVGRTGDYQDAAAWMVKVNASGEVAYENRVGLAGRYEEAANALVPLADGGVAIAGETALTVPGGTAPFLYELDAAGDVVTSEVYPTPVNRTAHDLVPTGDGGYLIVGGEGFSYYGSDDPAKAWAYRVDASGDPVWKETFRNGSADAVVPTDDGYAVLGTGQQILDAGAPGWLRRIDDGGTTLWERSMGSRAALARANDGGYALAYGTSGGMVTAPEFLNGVVEKRDAAGEEEWNRTLGVANTSGLTAVTTVDGNTYAAAGTTNGSFWLVELATENAPPRAYAGPDRAVDEGTQVTLDARQSVDPDGDALTYEWTQIAGPSVTLSDASDPTPTFAAPRVDAGTELAFAVTVTDDGGASDRARVNVTVRDAATVSRVAFEYEDYGGEVNLEVDGDRRTPEDLVDLDGATVGGATVEVPEPATALSGEGTVVVTGTIASFSVGGQEFLVDNVTFGPRDAPLADVEFDALTPAQSGYDVGDEFASERGVGMSVEPFVLADGETYGSGSGSRSDGDDPAFWPTNVNLRFNLSTVAGGAPRIDDDSVLLAPYPVETGEEPEIRVEVSNVGPDGEVFVRRTVDGVEREPIALEPTDGDVWSADLPAASEPGTNVSLAVVARNDAGTDALVRFPDPGTRSPDRSPLRYYAVREVKRVAVLLGRFPGESLPAALRDERAVHTWARAMEVDLNQFFASGAGSMGAVGFDLVVRPADGGFYTVDRTRAEYRSAVPGEDASAPFLEDLRSAARGDVDLDSYAFFVGTHPGGTGTDLLDGSNKSVYKTGRLEEGGNRIYAAMGARPTADGPHVDTWAHEFGHAIGFDHLSVDSPRVPVTDALMQSAGGRLSMAVPTRLGATVTPGPEHPDGVDWLSKDVVDLASIPASGRSIAVPAREGYDLGDAVPTVRAGATDAFGGALATEYVLETRPPQLSPNEARTIVYRDGRPLQNEELTAGESLTSVPSADPTSPCVRFTQAGASGSGGDFEATVHVEPVACTSDGVLVALDDRTSFAGTFDGVASGGNLTVPDLDLRAVDDAGRVTGITADGRFANEIPGAEASGDADGIEWITVPDEADVRFVVSSGDVARFLNRSGVASENVTVRYRTSVVSYGENATVERSGENYAVTGAAGTVTENRSLAPGATAAALDGSVVAAADVAPARPAPGEQVTVDGSLSVGLNTSVERYEWTVVGGAGDNGTEDPAGNRTTGNGTGATGPTLIRSFETAGTKRVRLTVTGADGASDTTTVTVRVVPPAPDVNGNGRAATDPDGDGRYEDVTGDGTVNVVDVAVLLARFEDPVVRDAVGQFDFEPDGTVNVVDVAELLRNL